MAGRRMREPAKVDLVDVVEPLKLRSLIHARPLGLVCRLCPLTPLRPHCIVRDVRFIMLAA
jgi:hypothetical protein